MSKLYLQKGGIDHFTDKGVELDNKSYISMFAGYGRYELPNAFFAPANELTFSREILPTGTISFSIERFDTPQLAIPATTIGVKVIQYNSEETELNSKEYMLCDGDKLYYEQEPPEENAVKVVVKITNWSRAYNHSTEGKITIYTGGLS